MTEGNNQPARIKFDPISRWERLTGQKAEVIEDAADENVGTTANEY
jgi:hypothetical protein